MNLVLERLEYTPDGTFGRLTLPSGKVLVTCEDPDQGNKPGVSCIPLGTYLCKPSRYYAGGYETHEITGVPGRSRILIHVGNTASDTSGCVLVGLRLGLIGDRKAVLESKKAFALYYAEMVDKEYLLEIRNHEPENVMSEALAPEPAKPSIQGQIVNLPKVTPGVESSEYATLQKVTKWGTLLASIFGSVATVLAAVAAPPLAVAIPAVLGTLAGAAAAVVGPAYIKGRVDVKVAAEYATQLKTDAAPIVAAIKARK